MQRVAFLIDSGERIDCLLNPETVQVTRLAGVRQRGGADGQLTGVGLADDPLLFTGGGRTELVLDLLFDIDFAEGQVRPTDVRALTRPLWMLAENSAVEHGWLRPPLVRMVWGKTWNVPGVIVAVAERFDAFTATGSPRRSWLRLKLVRVAEDARRAEEGFAEELSAAQTPTVAPGTAVVAAGDGTAADTSGVRFDLLAHDALGADRAARRQTAARRGDRPGHLGAGRRPPEPAHPVRGHAAPGTAALTGPVRIGASLDVRLDGHPEALFTGEVTAVEVEYAADGTAVLRVRGYDLLHRLRKRQRIRVFESVTAAELAAELCADLGLRVEAEVDGPHLDRLPHHRPNDLDLLVEVTGRAGLHLILDGDVLRLVTLDGYGEPIALQLGRDVHGLRLSVNADSAAGESAVLGWHPQRAEPIVQRVDTPRCGRRTPTDPDPAEVGGRGHARAAARPADPADRGGRAGGRHVRGDGGGAHRRRERSPESLLDHAAAGATFRVAGTSGGHPRHRHRRVRPGRSGPRAGGTARVRRGGRRLAGGAVPGSRPGQGACRVARSAGQRAGGAARW